LTGIHVKPLAVVFREFEMAIDVSFDGIGKPSACLLASGSSDLPLGQSFGFLRLPFRDTLNPRAHFKLGKFAVTVPSGVVWALGVKSVPL
jgi:hypothetical protein